MEQNIINMIQQATLTYLDIFLGILLLLVIFGYIFIQKFGNKEYKIFIFLGWTILSIPILYILISNWMNNHPIGGLLLLLLLIIGILKLIKNLILSEYAIKEIFGHFSRTFLAMMIVVIMSIIMPNLYSATKSCLKNIGVKTSNNKENDSSLFDDFVTMITPSFTKISNKGITLYIDKGLIPEGKIEKKIVEDRIYDLCKELAYFPEYRNLENIYVGGIFKKRGGDDDKYAIITSDGDEHKLSPPFIVIPDRGIIVKMRSGVVEAHPHKISLGVNKNTNSLTIKCGDSHLMVNQYGHLDGHIDFVE